MRVLPLENDGVNEVWISDRDRFSIKLALEEAIVNALLSAETMTGRLGTVHALPHDELVRIIESV